MLRHSTVNFIKLRLCSRTPFPIQKEVRGLKLEEAASDFSGKNVAMAITPKGL